MKFREVVRATEKFMDMKCRIKTHLEPFLLLTNSRRQRHLQDSTFKTGRSVLHIDAIGESSWNGSAWRRNWGRVDGSNSYDGKGQENVLEMHSV
jgi:hypothetical protein